MAYNNEFNQGDMRKIINETKMLVELFLKENLSDVELSGRTGIPSSTVGRRLTSKGVVAKLFGEDTYNEIMKRRKENSQLGKILGSQIASINNSYFGNSDTIPKLRLDIFFKDYDNQMKFLFHLALTFKLTFSSIEQLFQIDEENIRRLNILYNPNPEAFEYINAVEIDRQEEAKRKIITYYKSYLEAIKNKDAEERLRLKRAVVDYDANLVLKNRQPGDTATLEEVKIMMRYQIKYVLSNREISRTFSYDATNYRNKVKLVLEDPANKDLHREYENLMVYNKSFYNHMVQKHHG